MVLCLEYCVKERFTTAQRILIVKAFYENEEYGKCIQRSLCKMQCKEVVGIANGCERRPIDFPGLVMTLFYTRTSCYSVRRERFRLGDFIDETEPVFSNFAILVQ